MVSPPLSGGTATGLDVRTLRQRIIEVIRNYEPRLLADTVNVEVRVSEHLMSNKTLQFEVEADLWAQPLPMHLFLLTEFDLETGPSPSRIDGTTVRASWIHAY